MPRNQNDQHAVCILVDQVTPDVFFKLMNEGAGPHVLKYILGEPKADGSYSNATISKNVVTGFPSTSANSHVSLLTGSVAARTGILDTCFWVLDAKGRPHFRDTSSVKLSTLRDMNEVYLSRECQTMFEFVEDSASFHALHRGATYKLFTAATILKYLPMLVKLQNAKKDLTKPSPFGTPALWKKIFDDKLGAFLKKIKKTGKLPRATFIVFLLTDENGHKFGFDSEQYKEAIGVLDYFVQHIVEGFTRGQAHVAGLRELGLMNNVTWCLCTDHASRPVQRDHLVMINDAVEWELGLRLVEGRADERDKVIKGLKGDLSGINGLSVVDAASWHAWFGGQGGKEGGDFFTFHGEAALRSLMSKRGVPQVPTAINPDGTVDLIKYLVGLDSTHLVIVPEGEGSRKREHYKITFISRKGRAMVDRKTLDGSHSYSYKVLDGKDPLGYEGTGLAGGEYHSSADWLKKTAPLELPDVFYRMYGFFDCVHAPNLVVTSQYDYHYFSLAEKYPDAQFQSTRTHGGSFAMESVVPLTLAGKDVRDGHVAKQARNMDVLPTVLTAIGVEFERDAMDGVVVDEFLEEK